MTAALCPLLAVFALALLSGAGRTSAAPSSKLPSVVTPKVEWTPVYYKGRSYVPASQVAAYYDLTPPQVWTKAFTLKREKISSRERLTIELALGEKRARLNGWTFYFSFPVIKPQEMPMISVFDVRNVLDPILMPTARRDPAILRTVILDPAGGGRDKGIETNSLIEKNITLEIAQILAPLLRNNGYKVLLTREEDKLVLPADRVKAANAVLEEAVYINLRAASAPGAVKGFECSTLPPAGTPATNESDSPDIDKRFFAGNISDRESLALATTVQNSVVSAVQSIDLGVRRVRVDELRDLRMPAISCKLGYLSNKEEAKKLASPEYRAQLASAIVSGVDRYADFLRRGMAERAEEDRLRPLRFGPVTVKEEEYGSFTSIEITNPDRSQAAQASNPAPAPAPDRPAAPAALPEGSPDSQKPGSGEGAAPSPEAPPPPPAPEDKAAEPAATESPKEETPDAAGTSEGKTAPVPATGATAEPAATPAKPENPSPEPAPVPVPPSPSAPASPSPEKPEDGKGDDAKTTDSKPAPSATKKKTTAPAKRKSSGKSKTSRKNSAALLIPENGEDYAKKAPAKRGAAKKTSEKPESEKKAPEKKTPEKPAPEKTAPAATASPGDRVTLRLPIVSSGAANIDRSQMELQIFLFETVNGAEIDLTTSNPPETKWLSVLPDWKSGVPEWMQITYLRPPFSAVEEKQYGKRSYYGYVARLIYAGRVMDETSYPPNLDRCLYYFTPVFPRR